jgi:hypothetical protein
MIPVHKSAALLSYIPMVPTVNESWIFFIDVIQVMNRLHSGQQEIGVDISANGIMRG